MTFIKSCPLTTDYRPLVRGDGQGFFFPDFYFGILDSDITISGNGKVVAYSELINNHRGIVKIFNRLNVEDPWSSIEDLPHGNLHAQSNDLLQEGYYCVETQTVTDLTTFFGYEIKLNYDGTVLAILNRGFDYNYTNLWSIRIFEWDGSSWQERPSINGPYVNFTMSQDGLVIAAIRYNSSGSPTYTTEVFSWSNNSWSTLGSSSALSAIDDNISIELALNENGQVISLYHKDIDSLAIYYYNSSTEDWDILGSESIDVQFSLVYQIKLNRSGTRVAVSGKYNNASIKIFDLVNNQWQQLGSDITLPDPFSIVSQTYLFGHNMDMNGDGDLIIGGHFDVSGGPILARYYGVLFSYRLIDNEWQKDRRYLETGGYILNQVKDMFFGVEACLSYDGSSMVSCSLADESNLKINSYYDTPTIPKDVILSADGENTLKPGDLLFEVFIPFSMSCRYQITYVGSLADYLELRGRFFYLKSKPPESGFIRVTLSLIEDPEISFSRYYYLNTTYREIFCQPLCVDGSGSIYDINVLGCQAEPICDCESLGEILDLNLSELPTLECQ